jgi:uncharacterized SAM-binding protein YcdF (DUF218 family)
MRKRKHARSVEPSPAASRAQTRNRALIGFVAGFLFWLAAVQFLVGLSPYVTRDFTFPAFGLLGAWLAVSRFRRALWVLSGLLVLCFLVVGYTPLVAWLTRGWVRVDSLRRAPAVVVLAADGSPEMEITEKGQSRLLHGYEVVRQGYAPVMVVSRGATEASWIPAVKQQMESLALDAPLIETPRVRNTHDEAVEAAKIARERGWKELVLVTHPFHMRRAAGAFEKAGVEVIGSPCAEWRYNPDELNSMASRIIALREWIHEVVGCWWYRRKGWMD